ncbi:regulatory protein, luxR family [Actinacidiphila alni]|uniref:Regulatory protein, luxR family n=1 Tax=Actinacidiphila alni TaxID=380248 RepID=A0A1I1Z411_9ACTN|nr:LuxR C-terminal-related transcriptional regulator [Actinacidiphila alni]SFE26449.1 regulatory protein, luxR family [Actinacidiphila alni]
MSQPTGGGRDIESAVAIYTAVAMRGGSARAGESGAGGLGEMAGLDDERLAAGLRTLTAMGLIRRVDGRIETVDPDAALAVAMDTYLGTAAAQLRNAAALSETTQALLTVFRPVVARLQEQVDVQHFEDPESRQSSVADIEASARETMDSLHPGPMPPDMAVLDKALVGDMAMIRRGVRVRALYLRSQLRVPKYAKYLHDLSDAGVNVRLVDHAAHDLLVMDRHTVVLPGIPHEHATSMTLVRGAVLARSYAALYEDYWLRAAPLSAVARPDSGDGPDGLGLTDQERSIIRLMANGCSDDRIARTLGVARRTVQRVMTKLMERLQVSSRFEVGLKLAQLLDPEELWP